jgi:hypothetical protein
VDRERPLYRLQCVVSGQADGSKGMAAVERIGLSE